MLCPGYSLSCNVRVMVKKDFPGVIFENGNLPEYRYKMFRSAEELPERPDDSTDVFKGTPLCQQI